MRRTLLFLSTVLFALTITPPASASKPAREIVESLYAAVRGFCGERMQLDDMTAIVIKAETAGQTG